MQKFWVLIALLFVPCSLGAASVLEIWTTGSEQSTNLTDPVVIPDANFIVKSDGKVGIGTTAPDSLLHVYGNSGSANVFFDIENAASSTASIFRLTNDTNDTGGTSQFGVGGTNYNTGYADFKDRFYFYGREASAMTFVAGRDTDKDIEFYKKFTDTVPNVLFDSTGNVGIGTTNPTSKLYVSGDTYVTGNVSALSFTDRTPWYTGDALGEIAKIGGDTNGDLDHATLPVFASKLLYEPDKVEYATTSEGKVEEVKTAGALIESGRDLGAMVTMQTVAIQQLLKRVEALEANGHISQ